MMCVDIQLAEVELHESAPILVKDLPGNPEGRVDLLCMAEVQAERRIGQTIEVSAQLVGRSTRMLSVIHVLDASPPSEVSPASVIADRIRMEHHRPPPFHA